MVETGKNIIELMGQSNALSITLFIISLFVAFYLYFKTFYRLVYSTSRICKGCEKISEWNNEETKFETRILFYNNGRKTITKNEISKLEMKSSNKIESLKIIKSNGAIKTRINKKQNIIAMDIEYLNSKEFFVVEVSHSGKIDVIGRISETGNLLNTEPKYWLILNILFTIFFLFMIFYNLLNTADKENLFSLEFITNLLILFGIFKVMRFIHSILFIPDSLSSEFLRTKDKTAKEFKN